MRQSIELLALVLIIVICVALILSGADFVDEPIRIVQPLKVDSHVSSPPATAGSMPDGMNNPRGGVP